MEELKTWPEPFQAIWDGTKKYEIRTADRDFMLWGIVHLREYDPKKAKYTGREVAANITYITPKGAFGLPENTVVFGVKVYQWIDPTAETVKAPKV